MMDRVVSAHIYYQQQYRINIIYIFLNFNLDIFECGFLLLGLNLHVNNKILI